MGRTATRVGAGFAVAVAVSLLAVATARAGYYYVQDCADFGAHNGAFVGTSTGRGFKTADECQTNNGGFPAFDILQSGANFVLRGYGGQWGAATPSPLLQIVDAYTRPNAARVDCTLHKDGFTAQYFWGQNGHNNGTQDIVYEGAGCSGGMGGADGIDRTFTASRYFGWHVGCDLKSSCSAGSSGGRLLLVKGVQLQVRENTGPLILPAAGNVSYQRGWVRGSWPATIGAGDPSGVCTIGIAVDGQWLVPPYSDPARDRSSFIQCHGSEVPALLDTTRYPNGGVALRFGATNAAGVTSALAKTVLVDNAPVTLQLSGRTDAPSTAGTQYISARATAGPSGVSIACSVDGSPYQWHLGASAAIPVQGVGQHRVSCWAQNSALDIYGHPAISPLESWHIAIRVPTVITASFSTLVDKLKCRRETERVRVPGHWVTVRLHGRTVRRYRKAHWVNKRVLTCRPRLVLRRVRVHGRWRTMRIAVFPHLIEQTVRRVKFGTRATVAGWLGTTSGQPLAGQLVRILTSPYPGPVNFSQAAVVRTRSNGTWSVVLHKGPGRLVEAFYAGSPLTEPTVSPDARLVVPAKITIHVAPTHVRWRGQPVVITGQLWGGWIPTNRQEVSELLELHIAINGVGTAPVGIPDIDRSGHFRVTYGFCGGHGVVHYSFWVSSLSETNYPYASSRSANSKPITVGAGHGQRKC
jgi:hypothetical protein